MYYTVVGTQLGSVYRINYKVHALLSLHANPTHHVEIVSEELGWKSFFLKMGLSTLQKSVSELIFFFIRSAFQRHVTETADALPAWLYLIS